MPYGLEIIVDLVQCDAATFTRPNINDYFEELCQLIKMKPQERHFWDYEGCSPEEIEEARKDPRTFGISAVQFVLPSSIVIHTLPLLRACYVNIFSCRPFDVMTAVGFTTEFFGGIVENSHAIERGKSCPSMR